MKLLNKIEFKKIWEYFVVFFLFITFWVDNHAVSYYNKQVLDIWTYKMPYGLKLIDFGTDYSVNDKIGMGIGILPFHGHFALDTNLYIQQNLGYCQLKDRLAFFVRTNDNDLKIITVKGQAKKMPFKKRFQYKIYTPKEFFSDTALFPDNDSYYIRCISLRGSDGAPAGWPFKGWVILFLLISWFVYKVYHFFINRYKT